MKLQIQALSEKIGREIPLPRRGWGRTRRILRQSQWFLVHGLFGGKFVSYFRILFRGNLIFQRTDGLVWGGMVAGAF